MCAYIYIYITLLLFIKALYEMATAHLSHTHTCQGIMHKTYAHVICMNTLRANI